MSIEVSETKIISTDTAKKIALNELEEASKLLNNFINSDLCTRKICEIAFCIANAFKLGSKVISCGNGGSHCDAMHFAEELTGKFRKSRKGYPALAISDPSYISCVANDFGFDEIFSRFVDAVGKNGDVLFAITTSGNSTNILKAIKTAREKSMVVVLLTGNNGGVAVDMADISIVVPHMGYADRIQEIHIKIIHITILLVEKIMEFN